MPVLMVATYNEDGSVNVMNAAWGTMQERGTVALNLTETHKTVQNIKTRGGFTVSIARQCHFRVIYNHINTAKMVGCFNHIIYIKNFIFYSYHICFENISCLIMCQTASFHMI